MPDSMVDVPGSGEKKVVSLLVDPDLLNAPPPLTPGAAACLGWLWIVVESWRWSRGFREQLEDVKDKLRRRESSQNLQFKTVPLWNTFYTKKQLKTIFLQDLFDTSPPPVDFPRTFNGFNNC